MKVKTLLFNNSILPSWVLNLVPVFEMVTNCAVLQSCCYPQINIDGLFFQRRSFFRISSSSFGPFLHKSPFFPLKSFWPQVLKTRFHLCNHWRGGARKECQRQYMSTWMLVIPMKIYKYLDEGSLEFFGTDSTNRHQVEPGISWLGNGVICIIYNSPTTMNIRTFVAKWVISQTRAV